MARADRVVLTDATNRTERAGSLVSVVRALTLWRRHPLLFSGSVLLGGVLVLVLVGPWIFPADPTRVVPQDRFLTPDLQHPMGTDHFGRDVAARIVHGGRVSLMVAVMSMGLASTVGLPLGLLAGYFGGYADEVISRVMDSVMAFPSILLALMVVAVFGSGMGSLVVAVAVANIPAFVRITRASVMTVRFQEYVAAAVAVGCPLRRVLIRHVLPNALAPIMVQLGIGLANAVLLEAALSFLGLGTPPPQPSWGSMLNDAKGYMQRAPWVAVVPGAAIAMTVLACNFAADGLRDMLDPRLRRRVGP